MSPHERSDTLGPRLADRLSGARRRLFVGRAAELGLFRSALLADDPPFSLLYVHGPGGIGKTALLHEFARIAEDLGRRVARLDGRAIDPTPDAVLAALRPTAGPAGEMLPDNEVPDVLIVDTFERLAPIEGWLRDAFLPDLPARAVVVVAGRERPGAEWSTDLAWRDVARIVPLRGLTPDESRALLASLGVPADRHDAALAFARGHPLALALIGDVVAHGAADEPFAPERAAGAVRALVDRFVRDVPGADYRRALEVCAHARVTTESLLAEVLGDDAAPRLFAWLAGLSFVEHAPDGVFPHDVVRDVLDADLRWRAPDAYREMHRAVRRHVVRRFRESVGLEQQRAFFDLLYLHRHSPLMRPHYEWDALGSAFAERAMPDDHPAIVEMVRAHEGEASARIAAHWLERRPDAVVVFRSGAAPPIGFLMTLPAHETTPEDAEVDPALPAARAFAERHGPVRPGEAILIGRFWMGRERYQADPAVLNLVAAVSCRLWFTTPRLAWTFLLFAEPEPWRGMCDHLGFRRAAEADFEVGGRPYGAYAHDWRAEPPLAWLEAIGDRELAADAAAPRPDPDDAPLLVLSRDAFDRAVHQALRDFTRPDALAANPLLRTRLLATDTGGPPDPAALRQLLLEAVETLKGDPRDEKFYRALHRTFLNPARSQEAAAALLGLPFGTYRYRLARGIDRVSEWLWRRELHAPESDS